MSSHRLSLRNISKKYGENFFANIDVNFALARGEVHALVGENGAGKTTLMKILFGLEPATAGEIFVDDRKVEIASPVDAKRLRIGMVHQHFMLEDQLSIRDHLQIELNAIDRTWGLSRFGRHRARIDELVKRLNLHMPLRTPVGQLTVVQKQKVEILKTLLFDPEILIFDEPTAVLPPDEIQNFYRLVTELRSQNKSIALITHKISDVMANADRVTVLRLGQVQFLSSVRATTESEIARHMIGASAAAAAAAEKPQPTAHFKLSDEGRKPPLEVRQFSLLPSNIDDRSPEDLQKIDLTVRHGEIVALAGVEGNGQNALLNYLIRPEALRESIKYDGRLCVGDIKILGTTVVDDGEVLATDEGVRNLSLGFIGPDRLNDSAILEYGIADHFRLLPHYRQSAFLRPPPRELLDKAVAELDIRPPMTTMRLGQYSGGNQQKWVVGRETSHWPELLLACHPTRGVDFAATERIHKMLVEIKNRNRSVILLSSDIDEILKVSDRILVFFEGRIRAEFTRPFDRHAIGRAFGGRADTGAEGTTP